MLELPAGMARLHSAAADDGVEQSSTAAAADDDAATAVCLYHPVPAQLTAV